MALSARALLLLGGCFLPLRSQELYSTNAVCKRNNCINPIFPGLEDLSALETATYQCQPNMLVRQHMQFCKNAVHYNVALATGNATDLPGMVHQAERSAVKTFVFHLAGLNLEAKEYKHPEYSGNGCVQAVWKMVCNTYFPRAQRGCTAGKPALFLRPCRNTCESYVEACQVRCCDEGVRCVFERSEESILQVGKSTAKSGYVDALGPSFRCTGAAWRSTGSLALGAFIAFLLSFLHAL